MKIKELTIINTQFIHGRRIHNTQIDPYGYQEMELKIYKTQQKFNIDHIYKLNDNILYYGTCNLRDDEPLDLIDRKLENKLEVFDIEFINGEKYTVEKFEL